MGTRQRERAPPRVHGPVASASSQEEAEGAEQTEITSTAGSCFLTVRYVLETVGQSMQCDAVQDRSIQRCLLAWESKTGVASSEKKQLSFLLTPVLLAQNRP